MAESPWTPALVAERELCIGCGLCAVLAPDSVSMARDERGYRVPRATGVPLTTTDLRAFNQYCPGLGYRPPEPEPAVDVDALWGPARTVRVAWARDPVMRVQGSSGGALTALVSTLLAEGVVDVVLALGADPVEPLHNQARVVGALGDPVEAAGSRYAPGSSLDALAGLDAETRVAVVGKPCDIAGLRRALDVSPDRLPGVVLMLSFFCAGQPSEVGTVEVLGRLGVDRRDVTGVRYRGNGWPGPFSVTTRDGRTHEMPYGEAWGSVLNKHLHTRCKTCIDSVGQHADLVAADIWETDSRGYPVFDERDGRSAVMVRTAAGDAVFGMAVTTGRLADGPLDLEELKRVQPYQVERRKFAAARALGRRAAGSAAPSWRGFSRVRWVVHQPLGAARQAWGSFRRARRSVLSPEP